MPKTKLEQELQNADCIYVLAADGDPLMPTIRKGHVKRLLNRGKARIVSHVPFVIQLKYEGPKNVQPLAGGTDPGRTNIGEAAVKKDGECVYLAHVSTRNKEVPRNMKNRKKHRQESRRGERLRRKRRAKKNGTVRSFLNGRMLPGYSKPVMVKDIVNTEAKFNHRTRPEGWITPTVNQLVQTHISMVKRICSILPVKEWTLELNKFAFMKLDDGTCVGTDFQNGRLKGYSSAYEFVSDRQNGVCPFCGKPIEHYHHIVPRSQGGSDLPENILGVCLECHEKIHTGSLETKIKGVFKKYGALSVLNQAIPYIYRELVSIFGEDHVHVCTGKETHDMMKKHAIVKDHPEDAWCIACIGINEDPASQKPTAFEAQQFRRHNRANINNQKERTYRLNGKTVCKNRHKRFEQKTDSLEEFRMKHPEAVPLLKVIPSTRYYNDKNRVMPGTVFLYGGDRYVLSGQITGGRYYRAVGAEKKNFPADKCSVISGNTGLVYL